MKKALFGFGAVFIALVLFGPVLAPKDPLEQNLSDSFSAPSGTYWLGAADNGVDVLSQILSAFPYVGMLIVSVLFLSVVIGLLVGVGCATFRRHWLSDFLLLVMDAFQSIPTLPLYLVFLSFVDEPSLWHMIAALSFNRWVIFARLARASALHIQQNAYVLAAQSLGMPKSRTNFVHVVPNLMTPLLLQGASSAAGIVLAEATLSFLGIAPQGYFSWGQLLRDGAQQLMLAPHVSLFSGTTIALVAIFFALLGDQSVES